MLFNGEVQLLQRRDRLVSRGEGFGQILHLQKRHVATPNCSLRQIAQIDNLIDICLLALKPGIEL